jgi:branched-chain amino acid transport system substrate-binding protein
MRFKRFVALMLGAVTLCLGLIASGPATTSGAAQKSPIVIGVVCSCTGALASSVEVGPPAYEAWASYQNAHGGLNGHKIQIISKDDTASPTLALT